MNGKSINVLVKQFQNMIINKRFGCYYIIFFLSFIELSLVTFSSESMDELKWKRAISASNSSYKLVYRICTTSIEIANVTIYRMDSIVYRQFLHTKLQKEKERMNARLHSSLIIMISPLHYCIYACRYAVYLCACCNILFINIFRLFSMFQLVFYNIFLFFFCYFYSRWMSLFCLSATTFLLFV